MGIGRRKFLNLAGLALAGVAVNPLQSVVVNDDVYVNKKLGILFYKPAGWGFVAVKDFGKLKSEQILVEQPFFDQDEIWEELGDPICVATKHYQDLQNIKAYFRRP